MNGYTDIIIGLEVDETKPAYKHFYIQPHFNSNLDWVCIKRETAYGEIKIDWRVETWTSSIKR
ncbi:alpha-L-rhamnosidase C-terminal domain-containing protein [Bacillus pacificus]